VCSEVGFGRVDGGRVTFGGALREAVWSLAANPRRSVANATILMIGVAMSVAVLAVGESGRRDVVNEFERLRATEITLLERTPVATTDRNFPLDLNDRLVALGPVVAAGVLISTEPLDVALRWGVSDGRKFTVYGADSSTLQALGAETLPKAGWRANDCERQGWIGVEVARQLGLGLTFSDPATLDVDGQPLAIVGVVLSADLLPGLVDGIVVPECAARQMNFGVVSSKVVVRVQRGSAEAVAQVAPLVARPWNPSSLVVSYVPSPGRLRGVVERSTQRIVQFLGLGVMVLSGLILSVSNGAAVSARRPEIGLRRVFGARPKDLYAQVVLESCIVGLSAGLVGTSLGMAGTVVAAFVAGWTAATPVYVWLVGPVAGVVVAALAGVVPARRAARVEPRAAVESV